MSYFPAESEIPSAAARLFGRRLGQFSWALLDWSQQPYFTLITTFIFAPYFVTTFIGDPLRGQELWGYTQAAVGLIIALASPVFGAISDRMGRRKPWIAAFGMLYLMGNLVLWFAAPGAVHLVLMIIAAVVVAGIAAEFITVFSNAMLPDLATAAELGRLSGFGWALGYVGGLLSLIIIISAPVLKDTSGQWVGPLTAVWFLVFAPPLFLFTPDRLATGVHPTQAVREGLAQLWLTIQHARKYSNVMWFLLAHMIYADGLVAVFSFGGIYAASLFGWDVLTLGLFGIVLIIFGIFGSLAGGWADDRFGSRRTIVVSVAGLLFAMIGALSIQKESILFGIPVSPMAPAAGAFGSVSEMAYLGFGAMIGIFGGPAQAASRTLLARLAPKHMVGEFYGLYAMSGKATSFLAPLLVALATAALGSQRGGLAVIVLFLGVGFVLLLRVREAVTLQA